LSEIAKEGDEMSTIVTADRRMNEVIQLAKTVAQSKATVLIQGESGTGKELVAELVHQNSTRANKPFVAIIARPFLKTSLSQNSLGMSAVLLQEPSMPRRVSLNSPMAARFFWMRFPKWTSASRQSSCA